MDFRFKWVLVFLLLNFTLWIYIYIKNRKNIFIFSSSTSRINKIISSKVNYNLFFLKRKIILTGLLFLTLSASGPQVGTRIKPIERKGVDLVIALDTSTSMNSEDVTPSRLEKSKFELAQLIKNLKGDRVAIIVFAGASHLYLPLTTDYEAALLFLNEIDTEMIPTQGTSISAALNNAISAFQDDPEKFKVLLLISDGEDHEGEAIEIAKKASKVGLMINTVGVGSNSGSLVPIKNFNSNEKSYKRNNDGNLITSIPNVKILQEISKAGNGKSFWFSNNGDSYKIILNEIDNLEKKTISTHEYSEYEDRYQLFAFISFLMLLTGISMPTRNLNYE